MADEARADGDSLEVRVPDVRTFREFLEKEARVPTGRGEYGPYSFEGREALLEFVDTIDRVLGNTGEPPMRDATLALCGGAQFGKSTTELALGCFATSLAWLNWGFYLPDDRLVQGMVDTKFRPDVVDQIEWFAKMTRVGRAVNRSGRAVNRKGAFTVTDGKRRSAGMVLGLNKVPTSFTFDVTTLDEVDDIRPDREKYVRGRMTSSPLRLMVKIGTQRVAGRGQNKAWKDGSQGVMIHRCPACSRGQNLEESWPRCLRVALSGAPRGDDPVLTHTADFRREGSEVVCAVHDPKHTYYFACTQCGAALDRSARGFRWMHRRPDQERLANWSWRISQMGIPAIDVQQIVAHWARAVADPEEMNSFNCDRRAVPESTDQRLSDAILDRARAVSPYDLSPARREGCVAYAGLDTGRRCWFFARQVEEADAKRVLHVEPIALGNVVDRVTELCAHLGVTCLFIDQNPATDEARTLALRLNGLESLTEWPEPSESRDDAYLSLPGGLAWEGRTQRWIGLRCAVVAFTRRRVGQGIAQGFDRFEKAGRRMFVPLISCNRFETIDRVVREFLTPKENVNEAVPVAGGGMRIRSAPAMRLPRRVPGVLDLLDEHLLTGSERTDGGSGDYVDACENHLLLADAYSALAETVSHCGTATPLVIETVSRREERDGWGGLS